MSRWRRAALFCLLLLFAACERRPEKPPEPKLVLAPAAFTDLRDWEDDDPRPALRAFLRGCEVWRQLPQERPVDGKPLFGTVGDWLPLCREAGALADDPAAVRRFFEERFAVFAVRDNDRAEGLFTGYYEPLLDGSPVPDDRFRHPVYRLPDDLVTVDLGLFDPELEGRRIAGRLDGRRLVPYPDRAGIEDGALAGRGLELLWVDDPVALFFLHIQGSGRVRLPDGRLVRIGYAGQNGHPYRAIGRDLVELGELAREEVSLFSIRDWLRAHPERAPEIMARNRSYVFFRELGEVAEDEGPIGSMGVPLEPGRSLAVDRRFLPLGVPLWLDTTVPDPEGERPFRRLVVAQDTGGAIRGVVRGDIFFGSGPEAEFRAGHMKHPGRLFLLLPRALAPTG